MALTDDRRAVVVRYGDTNTHDFCALLDMDTSLCVSLNQELERAQNNSRWPQDFSVDEYSIECNGHEVDRNDSLTELFKKEFIKQDRCILQIRDINSPVKGLFLCKHDAGVLHRELGFSRGQTVKDTIEPILPDLAKLTFGGLSAKGWQIRRVLPKDGKFRKKKTDEQPRSEGQYSSHELFEIRPDWRTIWHPKRPRSIIALFFLTVLIGYFVWVANVDYVKVQFERGPIPVRVLLSEEGSNPLHGPRTFDLFDGETVPPEMPVELPRKAHLLKLRNPLHPLEDRTISPPTRWTPWRSWPVDVRISDGDTIISRVPIIPRANAELLKPPVTRRIDSEGHWQINGIVLAGIWEEWAMRQPENNSHQISLVPGRYSFAFVAGDSIPQASLNRTELQNINLLDFDLGAVEGIGKVKLFYSSTNDSGME
jgi:hypothetical protein